MNRINDRVIKNNVQEFVDSWNCCHRLLNVHGYSSSTIETYHLAQKILTEDRSSIDSIKSGGGIDYKSLQRLMDLHVSDDITFVAMHYPVFSNFKAFFYKKCDRGVRNLIVEHYGSEQFDNLGMVDALDEIKLYTTEPMLRKRVCDEILIREAVQDFMDSGDEASYNIQKQVDSHANAIRAELERAKSRLIADDYFKLQNKRLRRLEDLSKRVSLTVRLMLDISEN